ncbi:MAG: helix-turn-helix domain-containing protein [Oscillospiraceae bacterium]|jgi:transcriptional regulator with XRE-family HTH domain|nr:helix-turn-helix domain-containing protein [Oscillospiraceae bacterium]
MTVMSETMGTRIKSWRKAKSLTQEQLAESLGVSCQAVSKWETGITSPDIGMMPALADFFRVSIDQIFGYDKRERERAVMEIVDEAFRGYRRRGDCPGARRVLEEGLRRFPDDDVLLNNILCTIDPAEAPDELIALAQRLIVKTEMDDVKYDALRLLAAALAQKGDMAACAAALEQIPELYFTKLEWQAKLLRGEAREEAARKQKWLSLECLCDMMKALAGHYRSIGRPDWAEEEVQAVRAALDPLLPTDRSSHRTQRREQFEAYWQTTFGEIPPPSG